MRTILCNAPQRFPRYLEPVPRIGFLRALILLIILMPLDHLIEGAVCLLERCFRTVIAL